MIPLVVVAVTHLNPLIVVAVTHLKAMIVMVTVIRTSSHMMKHPIVADTVMEMEPDLEAISKREFYKSYYSWAKMTMDQRNKTLSYFHSLPIDMQGMYFISN